MGVKRPLEEENLPELSFEQPNHQLDNNKKLAFVSEDFPSRTTDAKVDSPDEAKNNFYRFDSDGMFESSGLDDALIGDKIVEESTPLSCVTNRSNSNEENVGNKISPFCPNTGGYIDFNMSFQSPDQVVDPYIYLLNVPPRKEIPVGPNYQAEVPEWVPSARGKDFPDSEQKWIGTCIVPMPALNDSSTDQFIVGRGRTADCSCLDMGSMRCVQQHVKEARNNLRDMLGDEAFTKLGFYEMGEEEIARRWPSDDQRLFHEVIFSSHGRDFWRQLSAVFPTRTKKELVSYYFNVFMLRRRAVQNRSYMLEIDSDNDEDQNIAHVDYRPNRHFLDDGDDLHCTREEFHLIDEDSEVECLSDQELDAEWMDEYGFEPETVHGNEDSDVNDAPCDGYVVKKDGNIAGEHSSENHATSDGNIPKQE